MDVLDYIIDEDKMDYKCYDTLIDLLKSDENFKDLISEGINTGKITKFSSELWDKVRNQNIRRIDSFEDVFREGANIGYCTVASKQLSYSIDNCFICGGVFPILKNTTNCVDGSHTWIYSNGKIIDTTLMLVIDKEFADKIGYQEENRYDPNSDLVYLATKQWTNDKTLNNNNKKKK